MALSKRVRFEVFKRDSFQCGYCGKVPPAVKLEVDHIVPRSHEENDEIENLITSCFDCNRGKSDIPLSSAPSSIMKNLEVTKEKWNQLKIYASFRKKIRAIEDKDIRSIAEIFENNNRGRTLTKSFEESVRKFIRQLSADEVREAMEIACSKYKRERAISYFCGICWRKIKG